MLDLRRGQSVKILERCPSSKEMELNFTKTIVLIQPSRKEWKTVP
jgi:hypothetical protein